VRRSGPSLVVILATGMVLLLVIVIAGGYVLAGNAVVSSHVSSAQSSLDAALSHQVDFAQSMSTVTGAFDSNASTSFDPKQYQASVNQFVQNTQKQGANIDGDQARLETAASKLNDMRWLTVFGRSSLDLAAARIAHAQKALAAEKTITTDYALDGQFFQAYAVALIDTGDLATESNASQAAAAIATSIQLKSDVGKALTLSTAPGLPTEVHDYMVDFQTVAADLVTLLNFALAGDQKGYDAAMTKLTADGTALDALPVSNIASDITSFYQPYVSTYRQELQLASS
jgi:hypothetical protein